MAGQPVQRLGKPDRTMHLLSATSAAADVVAFLKFHMVFTSAMTGNLALFGIAIGHGHLLSATHSLAALLGFILGIIIATLWKEHPLGLRWILGMETGFLVIYALLWVVWRFPPEGIPLYALIIFSAMSMGLQSVAARLINVAGVPSVVFTNTLTSIVISFFESLRQRKPFPFALQQQFAALLAYLFGAILFAYFLYQIPVLAMILPAVLVFLALLSHWRSVAAGS
ncbi:MAG: YoaK family protein [Acidithiobacillus sp.]